MKEYPILLNTAMVKAVLDGRKTQTRRPLKLQPDTHHWERIRGYEKEVKLLLCSDGLHAKFIDSIPNGTMNARATDEPLWVKCPFGQAGDRLWVRETFSYPEINDFIVNNIPPHCQQDVAEKEYGFHYWADGDHSVIGMVDFGILIHCWLELSTRSVLLPQDILLVAGNVFIVQVKEAVRWNCLTMKQESFLSWKKHGLRELWTEQITDFVALLFAQFADLKIIMKMGHYEMV